MVDTRRNRGAGPGILSIGAAALVLSAAACDGTGSEEGGDVAQPTSWRVVDIGDVAVVNVPADAHDRNVQPIDSIAGIIDGRGYEVVYEYGPHGRIGGSEKEQGHVIRDREVDGRTGTEASYRADGDPWSIVRVLQLQDGKDALSVTISCLDEETCQIADTIFDSVKFRAS